MSNEPPTGTDPVTEEAGRIASEGSAVRERVRDLVLRIVRERNLRLQEVSQLGRDVFDGAACAMSKAVPADQDNVLRRVIDGLTDAFAIAANATRLAFEEAGSRGQSFAEHDVTQTIDDLRTLEESFVESVSDVTGKAGKQTREQLSELATHARRAFGAARPSIEQALRAAASHPTSLAGEAGRAGAQVTRQTAGTLLQAMGGLLDAAGQIVSGSDDERTL